MRPGIHLTRAACALGSALAVLAFSPVAAARGPAGAEALFRAGREAPGPSVAPPTSASAAPALSPPAPPASSPAPPAPPPTSSDDPLDRRR